MRWFDELKLRFRTLFRRGQVDSELDRELQFHLEQQITENIAAGMSSNEARYAALRKIGGITQIEEQCRDQRGLHLLETTLQDVRYALRSLRKTPVFTLVAVLTLALGTGANIAIFSLIDSVLLSSLPVKNPDQLVFIRTDTVKAGFFNVSTMLLNRDFEQMQKRATQFEGFASTDRAARLNVGAGGHADITQGDFVSGSYFQVLGVQTQIGRAFGPEENLQSGGNLGGGWPAVISDGYWRRRFGTSPEIIGQRITVNTIPFEIVGVLPRNFAGLTLDEPADVMMPAITHNQVTAGSVAAGFPSLENSPNEVFGRLKPGASRSKAAAELTVIFRSTELADEKLAGAQREAMAKRFIELSPAARGSSFLRQSFAEPLRVLMAVVVLVMLIACANVASLLLARASVRQKETAIRLSLGCSRRRIMRQWLTESLVLSVLGCGVGVLIALIARRAIVKLGAGTREAWLSMHWDYSLLAFITVVCLLNAVIFGLVPALRLTRVDPNDALKSTSGTQQSGRLPFGRVLVTAQIAISLVLIAGSGLFLATLHNLYQVNLGFDTEHLLMMTIDPRLSGYDVMHAHSIYWRVLQEVGRLPSVQSATLMNNPLLTGRAHLSNAKFPGYVPHPEEDPTNTWILSYDVGPHYFKTLRMPLINGRDFTEADNEHAPPVVIVNEALAKHYFAGNNPIGQKVVLGSIFKRTDQNDKTEAQIVGLVRNAHYFDVQDQQQEAIFTALFQVQPDQFGWAQTVIIRTAGNPTTLTNDVRAIVQKIDANLSLFNVTTMSRQLDNSLSQPRLLALFSSFFGALALTLSAIGLYGVLAYSVNKRIGEIGIRMALGANRGRILQLILGETAQVLVIGIVAGLALAGAASRLIKSMLYGLSAHDARIFALSALVLVAVALLATMLPARRALGVEPMAALRYE
jgi:predicted permease